MENNIPDLLNALNPDNNSRKKDELRNRNSSDAWTLEQGSEERSGPLKLWYRLTAPPAVLPHATFQQRELVRRGRLTSATLLAVILLDLVVMPGALSDSNQTIFLALLIPLCADGLALVLNRLGKINAAGVLALLGIEASIVFSIVASPDGLTTYSLAQYDLLIQAELVAVALLAPISVFIIAALNIVITIASIVFLPHSAELTHALATNGYSVFMRPTVLQIMVAVVTYLLVTSTHQAIKRAGQVEAVAVLEQREIERQQREIEGRRQLDEGIQQILQTHVQVANGDFSARVPLKQENILWQIGYSLNNLLSRLQRLSQAEQELQRAKVATTRLVETVHEARTGHAPVHFSRTNTHLDALILEIFGGTSGNVTALRENQSTEQGRRINLREPMQ